jgi:hypothetical protein
VLEVDVEVDVKLAFELAFKTAFEFAFEFAFELPPVGEELPGEELLDIVIQSIGNICCNHMITFRFSYNGPFASCACFACSA